MTTQDYLTTLGSGILVGWLLLILIAAVFANIYGLRIESVTLEDVDDDEKEVVYQLTEEDLDADLELIEEDLDVKLTDQERRYLIKEVRDNFFVMDDFYWLVESTVKNIVEARDNDDDEC